MSLKEIAMKSKQGSYTQRALLAGLIAASGILAASAYAVSSTTADDKPRCEARQLHQGETGRDDRRAANLAGLKEKLGLSAEQEAAWNTFAAATQHGARRSGMERQAMRGDLDKLSTPERLDRMLAMSELRRTHLVERVQAIKVLYAQLTPEQQRVFDAEAMPVPHRHGHHHPHHQS